MPTIAIGGYLGVEVEIGIPLIGAWHLDALVDADDSQPLAGKVQVAIGDGALALTGTVLPSRSGNFLQSKRVRIVGGAGGLGTVTAPKFYGNSPTLRIVLVDLLAGAGEVLSPTSDAAVLGTSLAAWTTIAHETGLALRTLLAQTGDGTHYRILPDGSFWCGPETWLDSGLDYQLLDAHPNEAKWEIASVAPTLLPGTLLDGHRVSYVHHVVTAEGVRSSVWFDS